MPKGALVPMFFFFTYMGGSIPLRGRLSGVEDYYSEPPVHPPSAYASAYKAVNVSSSTIPSTFSRSVRMLNKPAIIFCLFVVSDSLRTCKRIVTEYKEP